MDFKSLRSPKFHVAPTQSKSTYLVAPVDSNQVCLNISIVVFVCQTWIYGQECPYILPKKNQHRLPITYTMHSQDQRNQSTNISEDEKLYSLHHSDHGDFIFIKREPMITTTDFIIIERNPMITTTHIDEADVASESESERVQIEQPREEAEIDHHDFNNTEDEANNDQDGNESNESDENEPHEGPIKHRDFDLDLLVNVGKLLMEDSLDDTLPMQSDSLPVQPDRIIDMMIRVAKSVQPESLPEQPDRIIDMIYVVGTVVLVPVLCVVATILNRRR